MTGNISSFHAYLLAFTILQSLNCSLRM